MKTFPNFYENFNEACIRLNSTVVLYDGEPYQIIALAEHMPPIFRVYLAPLGLSEMEGVDTEMPNLRNCLPTPEGYKYGPFLDEWMEAHPRSPILRKQIDSPYFNKFRPFPLGMMNSEGRVFYVERQPTRRTEQGLTASALDYAEISLLDGTPLPPNPKGHGPVSITSMAFKDMVLGRYPTVGECLSNLLSPDVVNYAAAFHRHFAFARGPIGIIFVAYKGDIIGVLPTNSLAEITLSREARYLKEAVEELNIFGNISIKK